MFGHCFNVFFPTRDLQLSILYSGIQSADARARMMLKATLVALQRNQQRTLDLFVNIEDDGSGRDVARTEEEFLKGLRKASPEIESAMKKNFMRVDTSSGSRKYTKYLKNTLKKDMYVVAVFAHLVSREAHPSILLFKIGSFCVGTLQDQIFLIWNA